MNAQRVKIIISLVLSLIVSYLLINNVFFLNTPRISPFFVMRMQQMPVTIQQATTNILKRTTQAPQVTPVSGIPGGRQSYLASPTPPPPTVIPPTQRPGQPTYTPVPPTIVPTATPTPGYITVVPTQGTPNGGGLPPATPTSPPPLTFTQFGQCLTMNGMKFYSTSTCPVCQQQKSDLGAGLSYVTIINCDNQVQLCRSKGVGKGPAWEDKNGKVYLGAMDLRSLSYISKCGQPTASGLQLLIDQVNSILGFQ